MHALIVTAHPRRPALVHAVADAVAGGARAAGHTATVADLAAEGFDPRFNADDFAVHDRTAPPPADVLAEQRRIDAADALVLVYPVFWWSMPGQLKGWIDRVFTNGWAYETADDDAIVRRLQRLRVHLVALGGADLRTYARHAYFGAMRTQIDHGIFGYCGARVVRSELLVPPDTPTARLEQAEALGRTLFAPAAVAEAA